MKTNVDGLLQPPRFWSRHEVLTTEAVPRLPGIYAWWFREIPPGVPPEGCIVHADVTLLYIGVAPKAPPTNGKLPSKQTLRSRLRYHMRGNAEGSTLRLTLGCLLTDQLEIELRCVGSGKRMTFGAGENKLNEWLAANAFVCWVVSETPWELESSLIGSVCLPLNLALNKNHAFHARLSACRAAAKAQARELPIAYHRHSSVK